MLSVANMFKISNLPAIIIANVCEHFQIAGRAPVVESLLAKQQEKFLHSTTFSWIFMFQKVALLEISRNSLLVVVYRSQRY